MSSKREKMEKSITDCMQNLNASDNQLFQLLTEYRRYFYPDFFLSLNIKKKDQEEYCHGFCLQTQTKHKKDALNSFGEQHNHLYCTGCVQRWLMENLNTNPLTQIRCQQCAILNKPGPVFNDDDICYFLNTNHECLNEIRNNFQVAKNSSKCVNCGNPVSNEEIKGFLCLHEYCNNCLGILIKMNLDQYYSIINDPNNQVDNLYFELKCHFNCDLSVQNQVASKLLENLQNCQVFENKQLYIEFVNKFAGFFTRTAKLFRCKKCKTVFETTTNVSVCKNCGSCVGCGNYSHPGLTCQQISTYSDKYVYSVNSPMLPQPPEGNPQILKVYAILHSKMETSLQAKRKIVKVWEVHNQLQEYYFNFPKKKKNILSPLMNGPEKDALLASGFPPDTKNWYSFPATLNNQNQKKFMFYLEVMFDKELSNADPETIPENEKSQMLMTNFRGMYAFNSIRCIRIVYLIEFQ